MRSFRRDLTLAAAAAALCLTGAACEAKRMPDQTPPRPAPAVSVAPSAAAAALVHAKDACADLERWNDATDPALLDSATSKAGSAARLDGYYAAFAGEVDEFATSHRAGVVMLDALSDSDLPLSDPVNKAKQSDAAAQFSDAAYALDRAVRMCKGYGAPMTIEALPQG